MKTLLMDIGNSRLKWAVLSGGRLGSLRACEIAGASVQRLARELGGLRDVHRTLAVNVAGARGERLLRGALHLRALPPPQFVRSTARAAGVVNAYPEPWRLGADRWVALIGAHRLAPGRAVCIASVGTAMTLDLVDAAGRHRGGLIVPGPELMRRSLLEQTSGIRRRAATARAKAATTTAAVAPRRPGPGFFARNTATAVQAGPAHACAALIDAGMRQARGLLGARPVLLLTGGGAPTVAASLRTRHRLQQDLVLQGLAVLAAPEQEGA